MHRYIIVYMSNSKKEKIKVLHVEDDSFLVSLYSIKFNSAGFEYSIIASIDDDFVKKIIQMKPDLIMMDIYPCSIRCIDSAFVR